MKDLVVEAKNFPPEEIQEIRSQDTDIYFPHKALFRDHRDTVLKLVYFSHYYLFIYLTFFRLVAILVQSCAH